MILYVYLRKHVLCDEFRIQIAKHLVTFTCGSMYIKCISIKHDLDTTY